MKSVTESPGAGQLTPTREGPYPGQGPWADYEVPVLNLKAVIHSNDPTVAKRLRTVFTGPNPPLAGQPMCQDYHARVGLTPGPEGSFYLVHRNGRLSFATRDLDLLLVYLENSIITTLAENLARRYHLIHAAALARNGCGIVFPAPSGGGKSVIAAGLALSGFQYFSDEIAVLTPEAHLLPFPKAISLQTEGWLKVHTEFREQLRAKDVGSQDGGGLRYLPTNATPRGSHLRAGCPVRLIIQPRYQPGEPASVEPLSKAAALGRMVEQSLGLHQNRARGMEVLVQLVAGADCYILNMDSLGEAAALVARLAM